MKRLIILFGLVCLFSSLAIASPKQELKDQFSKIFNAFHDNVMPAYTLMYFGITRLAYDQKRWDKAAGNGRLKMVCNQLDQFRLFESKIPNQVSDWAISKDYFEEYQILRKKLSQDGLDCFYAPTTALWERLNTMCVHFKNSDQRAARNHGEVFHRKFSEYWMKATNEKAACLQTINSF